MKNIKIALVTLSAAALAFGSTFAANVTSGSTITAPKKVVKTVKKVATPKKVLKKVAPKTTVKKVVKKIAPKTTAKKIVKKAPKVATGSTATK